MNNFCQLSNICCLLYTRIFNTYVCVYFVYLITTVFIFHIVNQFSIQFLADIFIFFNFWGFFLSFKNGLNWPAADSCSHFLQNSRGLGIFFLLANSVRSLGPNTWEMFFESFYQSFFLIFASLENVSCKSRKWIDYAPSQFD